MMFNFRSKIKKVFSSLRRNPLAFAKELLTLFFSVPLKIIDGAILIFVKIVVYILSNQNAARLKSYLNPVAKLDYARVPVFLNADSDLSFYRARACAKEPETIAWIETYIKPGDVFYDVGANVGAYALVASAFLGGSVRVFAFEPSFSTYYQLCKNIILNKRSDNIFPYMVALSNRADLFTFHYRSLQGGSADHFLALSPDLNGESHYVYKQRIFSYSLDVLVEEYRFPMPNHIKIDVDGSEFEVLQGAHNCLEKGCINSILVEVRVADGCAERIEKYLSSFGYQLISKHDRGGGEIWNYIFSNQKQEMNCE